MGRSLDGKRRERADPTALPIFPRSPDRGNIDQALDRQRDPFPRPSRRNCRFRDFAPGLLTINGLSDLGRQFAEFGLIVLGLTIVMISGGIDLSVASVYTLAVLLSLICVNVEGWPVGLSFLAVMALGVVCGSINGYLIGYLRLRAFLTTLVTLIIFRSIYDIVFLRTSTAIISSLSDSDLWTFIGEGTVLGVPFTLVVTALIAIAWHIVLSRTRPGWRLTAVGGARRSAYNAGIKVRRTVCAAYIWSSVLSALAGFLFAARIGSTGATRA